MFKYVKESSYSFGKDIKHYIKNQKTKQILKKSIDKILENPYHKAEKVKGASGDKGVTIFRRHICGDSFRIFYSVDEKVKKVKFYFIRPKNKLTYKINFN